MVSEDKAVELRSYADSLVLILVIAVDGLGEVVLKFHCKTLIFNDVLKSY